MEGARGGPITATSLSLPSCANEDEGWRAAEVELEGGGRACTEDDVEAQEEPGGGGGAKEEAGDETAAGDVEAAGGGVGEEPFSSTGAAGADWGPDEMSGPAGW